MNISIFGLGYVGCVGAACCARLGHYVIGVDVAVAKVAQINAGKPTIIEAQIGELVQEAYEQNRLEATTDVGDAVCRSEISLICVGTPSSKEGHLNLDYIFAVAKEIGEALRSKESFHIIAIRSTVLPGTNKRVGDLVAKESDKEEGKDFAVVSNPEFMREGTAVNDYLNPPFTLIGTDNTYAEAKMRELYTDIPGEFIVSDIATAEIIKYVNNTFHALKVTFANEIGSICKALAIDSHKVMDIFCKDTQLNLSPYYLRPGFAYGGSCLPKDTKALRTLAHDHYLNLPVINAIEASNEGQKRRVLEIIEAKGKRKIAILGLSFKPGTDDLRSSPSVDLAENLLGKGYLLRIFDRNVRLSQLTGTNADFINEALPHLNEIISDDLDTVLDDSEIIVIANKEKEFATLKERYPKRIIIDLVRQFDEVDYDGEYEGIAW
ncbi:MAG: UDP-glucose/GDP-mannose dehydrogenase family protein [Lachnospiraceae bacterium]|nr:UDP-glucose/GDP-mannose dehydrogenase family protein [Lachnospiraceae bacterium]